MIEHLVVDSGGFVRNCPIHEMCKNAYTVPGVVAEIKDKQTRQRLKVRGLKFWIIFPRKRSFWLLKRVRVT